MNPGDMVTLRGGLVAVNLMGDTMEKSLDEMSKKDLESVLTTYDIRSFRRGDTGMVIEINQLNTARVKIFYRSGFWWGNVSDMVVIK